MTLWRSSNRECAVSIRLVTNLPIIERTAPGGRSKSRASVKASSCATATATRQIGRGEAPLRPYLSACCIPNLLLYVEQHIIFVFSMTTQNRPSKKTPPENRFQQIFRNSFFPAIFVLILLYFLFSSIS